MPILARKPDSDRHLSTELEELIRGAIRRGELKPGEKLGSARQLAKHWKTSYGAVRQSLETLAAKGIVVRRPRAGTFVSSDPISSSAAGDRRNIIGLLVPDIRMPEYSLVTRHLQDAGHTAHFEVLVSSTDNERERYDQSVLRHLKAGVGGLVLVSPQQARISLETLVEIKKSGIPVVNYARTLDVAGWPSVMTDVYRAAYLPMKHLCDLGRKRIGFLTYSIPASLSPQMHYGLYRALADSGLTSKNIVEMSLSDELYLSGWADNRSLTQLVGRWLDEHPDVDALCCMHDHIAASALMVLRERGVRVPDDIAVTGQMCGADFFGLAPGELTSVNTRMEHAASEIIRLLQAGAGADLDRPATIVAIEPRLIVGRSTVPNGGATTAS
jgi:DNA-binding LacI/PurR family transcriptional regulator